MIFSFYVLLMRMKKQPEAQSDWKELIGEIIEGFNIATQMKFLQILSTYLDNEIPSAEFFENTFI